jgi:hypothetical protein
MELPKLFYGGIKPNNYPASEEAVSLFGLQGIMENVLYLSAYRGGM